MKDYADKKDETSLSFLQRIIRFIGMQNSKPFLRINLLNQCPYCNIVYVG